MILRHIKMQGLGSNVRGGYAGYKVVALRLMVLVLVVRRWYTLMNFFSFPFFPSLHFQSSL